MSQSKPTLHHLNHSQSQRVLWLFEELGVDYDVKFYSRQPVTFRAPPELATVHPMGKSPTLVTADGRAISESTAIITYILRTYDTAGRFSAADWILDEELVSFASSTLGSMIMLQLFSDMTDKTRPRSPIATAAFKQQLTFLSNVLGDKEWFSGDHPGRADFVLSFPFDMIAQRKYVDFDTEYPQLAKYIKRYEARPAWKRGLEKGNGYDLSVF
ncbi:MAG: hypothetical protein M1819_005880 [Sarea resinae]|nr:MAG: hypothetical protein M1819_005880 [Sarea resinae]